MSYIQPKQSMAARWAGNTDETLRTIANRFVGVHPKHPPVLRTSSRAGFIRGEDYRYEMNLGQRFEELLPGSYVYVWSKLWQDKDGELPFSVSCYSPVRVYINGIVQFESNLNDDVFPERKTGFRGKLLQGYNDIMLEFTAVGTGCGGRFGTGSVKGAPLHFLCPTREREGQEGWIYSEPQKKRWEQLPVGEQSESELAEGTGSRWYPERHWTPKELEKGVFGRIFGGEGPEQGLLAGSIGFAWSTLVNPMPREAVLSLKGNYCGPFTLLVDGKPMHRERQAAGQFELSLKLGYGAHDVLIRSECASTSEWGITFEPLDAKLSIQWAQPRPVEGLADQWLYLGPFQAGSAPESSALHRIDTVYGEGEEQTYWRADLPETWVRPFLENPMFGRWNYPLGVTLYGILQTGLELKSPDLTEYVLAHIEQCTRFNRYALWDLSQYGAPGLNHQLALIDSLDDCGSFGATMLRADRVRPLEGTGEAADRIADYITREQDRLPDGALYRVRGTTDFMKDTMWCDDLYMSTPFLCQYYERTGDPKYVNDAAQQFMLYRSYLFMPDQQIMHHVYDLKFGRGNGVPWGRGNGWVLFSLTELLAVLPEEHERREELLAFFRELCVGYLRLQGDNGLWHQVLTDPESYEEASCTSMFIYAFARGIRFGWLQEQAPYVQAVNRAWDALTRRCLDQFGNVYGVCRGSGYSHNADYYKHQLGWLLNDTHGIGIVLLAGIEKRKLDTYLTSIGVSHVTVVH
ncbi:glycoside hydrolase family 88/105 protein [Paenibacillus turpanensis]|uniref:glycoside hydrolase family 88/105 protein n=1 Tax=Paenibacillus turpanensis TaxID=2689078 RepID=UPI0014092CC1|nr:glycoside hydrolase family 88 protein [Paenibacillus turpanensis]